MKLKKILTCMVSTMCAAIMTLSMVSCGNAHTKKETSSSASSSSSKAESSESSENKVDDSKSFVIALYPEYAPETCANFEKLVKEGFYEGLIFHRVYEGFMAQGGGMDKDLKQKQSPNIKGEFAANGFTQNTLSHTRGVVSMARATDMNSASSQFFICYNDKNIAALDGRYAGFGKVTKGMDVVDDFLKVERAMAGEQVPTYPVTPIVIVKAEMIEDDSEGHHQVKFYMDF